MQKIEMNQQNIRMGTGHSSKGNQMKWYQDGYWYKADAFGYESLAETVVSHLLEYAKKPAEHVRYEPVWICYHDQCCRGCRSRDFKRQGEELVTLEHLHRSFTGQSLSKHLAYISDVKDKVRYVTEMVFDYTGIENFEDYIAVMLGMDAFFLNEDRHTNNIALLYNGEDDTYRCCPFFDIGLSLYSNTRWAYPLDMPFEMCRKKIEAKPFCRDFDEQLDAAEEVSGTFLQFELLRSDFLGKVRLLLGKEDIIEAYSEKERERVLETLQYQAGKYLYMLK